MLEVASERANSRKSPVFSSPWRSGPPFLQLEGPTQDTNGGQVLGRPAFVRLDHRGHARTVTINPPVRGRSLRGS